MQTETLTPSVRLAPLPKGVLTRCCKQVPTVVQNRIRKCPYLAIMCRNGEPRCRQHACEE